MSENSKEAAHTITATVEKKNTQFTYDGTWDNLIQNAVAAGAVALDVIADGTRRRYRLQSRADGSFSLNSIRAPFMV
jgi:hypothetical protein